MTMPMIAKRQRAPLYTEPAIPLDRALLCLDCESVFESKGPGVCPSCASTVCMALASALNRQRDEAGE